MGRSEALYAMACEEAATGQHRSSPASPNFTTVYFHEPAEFAREFQESEFDLEDLVGIEGPAWLVPDFPALWENDSRRAQILRTAEN